MSHRQAKRIRKACRGAGVDVRQAVLTDNGKYGVRFIQDGVDEKGLPKKRKFIYTGTLTLTPNCGRRIYKDLKAGAQ